MIISRCWRLEYVAWCDARAQHLINRHSPKGLDWWYQPYMVFSLISLFSMPHDCSCAHPNYSVSALFDLLVDINWIHGLVLKHAVYGSELRPQTGNILLLGFTRSKPWKYLIGHDHLSQFLFPVKDSFVLFPTYLLDTSGRRFGGRKNLQVRTVCFQLEKGCCLARRARSKTVIRLAHPLTLSP